MLRKPRQVAQQNNLKKLFAFGKGTSVWLYSNCGWIWRCASPVLGRHVEAYGSAAFPSEITLSWTRNNPGQCKPCNTILPSLSLKSQIVLKHCGFLCSLESKLVHKEGLCECVHSCYQERCWRSSGGSASPPVGVV